MHASPNMIEQFTVTGSHYEVGLAIGRQFARQINQMLDTYPLFQQHILNYHDTAEGQARYRQLLEVNQARYPDYITELEGLAQGAGRSFETLFLINMRGEYRDYLHGLDMLGCSDCVVVTDEAAIIGHNEDGAPAFSGNMYLVQVNVVNKPAFTAFSYPGFLCGNAFGFNDNGICFSVDNVRPRNVEMGIGRHFIARSLLESTSLDDAIKRVTVPGRAAGFSYTIGSIPQRRVVIAEVAPGNKHYVRDMKGVYFHANHYQELEMNETKQVIGDSSRARVRRASELLHGKTTLDATGVLSILGDRANNQYPICRTASGPDTGKTLCTALFDLDNRQLQIYPNRAVEEFDTTTPAVFDIK